MLYYTEKAATFAIVFLMTFAFCSTTIQEVRTQFVKNTLLSTIYATRQSISQLHCVQWCSTERKSGKCKIAGYNKHAKACSLSMDYQHNLLDVADETKGVFLMEEGNFPSFMKRDLSRRSYFGFYSSQYRDAKSKSARIVTKRT